MIRLWNENKQIVVCLGTGDEVSRLVRWTYRHRDCWAHMSYDGVALRGDRAYAFIAEKAKIPGVAGISTVMSLRNRALILEGFTEMK